MPRLVDVQIRGVRDAQGRFARARAEVTRARRDELRGLGRTVVAALRAEAPERTGELKKGIGFKTYERGSVLELVVTSAAPHTEVVIRGRGPVVAKRAKALRFEPGPPGSGFIFRKRVGPAKANPFQARALTKLRDEPFATARRMARRIESAYAYGPGRSLGAPA